MHLLGLMLALLAAPFWEAKPPDAWSDLELERMFTDSPWGEVVEPEPAQHVYLSSALPMQQAEAEAARRKHLSPDERDPDYADFLQQDRGRHIVVAIPFRNVRALSEAAEELRMEEDSRMRVGKKSYKMTGHFPPTDSDPVLRLVFPRNLDRGDTRLLFELYLPGIPNPLRSAQFELKEMVYKGKLEL